MKNAIILCSGGIDSVTTAYYVKNKLKYKKITILFFNYGQKSIKKEKEFAKKCSKKIGAKFCEIKLNFLKKISTSLINKKGAIKKISKKDLKNTKKESEKYYVPCRNSVFLIYSLALAEAEYIKEKKETDIFVGFKCEGQETYPDTTKKFVKEINHLRKIICMGKFKIKAPLIKKDKEDIILLGKKLGVKFEDTFTCYVGKRKHCGNCLACQLRQQGFYWANLKDPTKYKNFY